MNKKLFAAMSLVAGVGFSSQVLAAECLQQASQSDMEKGLRYFKEINTFFNKIEGKDFLNKDKYWEATTTSKNGLETTIVVFKRANKKFLDVAFTSPDARMGHLIKAVDKGEFAKIKLKHATTIIVGRNSPLGAKQGSVEVACLPKPIAKAITAANPKLKKIKLPSGLFMINQFQPGQSALIEKVFKTAGLTYPISSSVTMDGPSYVNMLNQKSGMTLAVFLTKNNGFSRLMELTQLFKTPKNSQPVIAISSGSSYGALAKIGIAYKAPYLVMGKGPIATSTSISFATKGVLSGELSVGVGKAKNPVIIPNLVKLNDVTLEGMEVAFGFKAGAGEAEVSAGIEIEKMKLDGIKKTFSPVRLSLAMGPAGPAGALIEIRTEDTLYMSGVAALAKMAINANPRSKIIPAAWKGKDIFKLLQLDKLPQIGISKPQIYLATPGQDDSTHLADVHDIFGAGIHIKGDLEVMGKTILQREFGLDVKNGFVSVFKTPPFSIGAMRVGKNIQEIRADLNGNLPYYRVTGDLLIEDLRIAKTDLYFANDGFKILYDYGCLPPMVRVAVQTKGWKKYSGGIRESECGARLGKAVAKAAIVAGKAIEKTAKQGATAVAKESKKVGDWTNKAASDTAKFAKKAGCAIDGFFGGKGCKSGKAKSKKKEALRAAKKYRSIPNPGTCHGGWHWNHKYRRCHPGGDYKMVYYAKDGADKGRCLTHGGGRREKGKNAILWDCVGNWNQIFRFVPWKTKSKYFRIKTSYNKCVGFKTKATVGAPVASWDCNKGLGQRWQLVGGKMVGHNGLCLRVKGVNKNKAQLFGDHCNTDAKSRGLSAEIANLGQEIAILKDRRIKEFQKKAKARVRPSNQFNQRKFVRGGDKKLIAKLDRSIKSKESERAKRQKQQKRANRGTKDTPPVEWITFKPTPDPVKEFHVAYNAPQRAMLKMGGFCFDKTNSLLPKTKTQLYPCSSKDLDQVFSLGPVGGGRFALVSQNSKMCIGVENNKTNWRVKQHPCHYGSSQLWWAVAPGRKGIDANTLKGKFVLRNSHSGKCIAPTAFAQDYTPAGKKQLAKMTQRQRAQCENVNPFQNFGRPKCPQKGLVISKTFRKRAVLRQVPCNTADKFQQFTLVKH